MTVQQHKPAGLRRYRNGDARSWYSVSVRIDADELAVIKAALAKSGESFSSFARRAFMAEAATNSATSGEVHGL